MGEVIAKAVVAVCRKQTATQLGKLLKTQRVRESACVCPFVCVGGCACVRMGVREKIACRSDQLDK